MLELEILFVADIGFKLVLLKTCPFFVGLISKAFTFQISMKSPSQHGLDTDVISLGKSYIFLQHPAANFCSVLFFTAMFSLVASQNSALPK